MKFALRERFLTPIASSSRSLTNVRGNGEKVEIFSMDFIFAGTVFVALFIFLPQRNQRKRSLGFSLVKFQLSTINYKLSCFSLRRRRGAFNFFFLCSRFRSFRAIDVRGESRPFRAGFLFICYPGLPPWAERSRAFSA